MKEKELERLTNLKQIEKELESILEKCPNLTTIYLSNDKGNCELDNIEFLKKAKKLKSLNLYYQSDIDYSVISECTKLQFLSLHCCDISDLSRIGELENLDSLVLTGTNVSEATDILKLKNKREKEKEIKSYLDELVDNALNNFCDSIDEISTNSLNAIKRNINRIKKNNEESIENIKKEIEENMKLSESEIEAKRKEYDRKEEIINNFLETIK